MSEEIVLNNQDSFNIEHIFECGQCFRWNKESDGSYTGVIKDAVLNVRQTEKNIIITGKAISGNFKELVTDYFDLNTDYNIYKNKLSRIDEYLKQSIEFGNGIRILNQDIWECIISFIISANNNIPRIKKIITRLSENYGNKIEWNGKEYFTFPTPEQLSRASIQDLRNLGLGFRDKRVYHTTQMILNNEIDISKLQNINDTKVIREELLKLDGVGEKVADCIILFSFKKKDVFPIDVWVRRVMNDLYIHNEIEEKVTKLEINKLADNKFCELKGLAQQYLFYWKRENT